MVVKHRWIIKSTLPAPFPIIVDVRASYGFT